MQLDMLAKVKDVPQWFIPHTAVQLDDYHNEYAIWLGLLKDAPAPAQ